MKQSNSYVLKTLLEQWLPRLIALVILTFVIYSIFYSKDRLSFLHIIALAIIVLLVLAPMASRLKLLNIIDFGSKLDGLIQEQRVTKSEIGELRNQVSNYISTRVNPIQIMTMNGSEMVKELLSNFNKTENKLDKTELIEKDIIYTKEMFLVRSLGFLKEAFIFLMLTMTFQVAVRERRKIELDDYVKGESLDEEISNVLEKILSNDIDKVFAIEMINEKGIMSSAITPETIEGLKQLNSLIELRRKVKKDEIEIPSSDDINKLFSRINEALTTLGIVLQVVGTKAILYRYAVEDVLDRMIHGTERDNSK